MKLNNVTITAAIPSSGYAPGQVISIDMGVNNKSNCDIANFRIVLNKVRELISCCCCDLKSRRDRGQADRCQFFVMKTTVGFKYQPDLDSSFFFITFYYFFLNYFLQSSI